MPKKNAKTEEKITVRVLGYKEPRVYDPVRHERAVKAVVGIFNDLWRKEQEDKAE